MNTGAISTRYAKALLRWSQESGAADAVAGQVRTMLSDPDNIPQKLVPELEKFVAFLIAKGRKEYLRSVFRKFIELYNREVGVKYARLTAVGDSPALTEKIRTLLEKQTGCKVNMETVVDPGLIGGFVVEVDGYTLDASVRHQIDTVRRQFMVSNNRIV